MISKIINSGKVINSILSKCGAKVFPVVADNVEGNIIVYRRNSVDIERVKQQVVRVSAKYELLLICDDYSKSIDIANKVILLMNNYNNNDYHIQFIDNEEQFGEDKYYQRLVFDIWVEEK